MREQVAQLIVDLQLERCHEVNICSLRLIAAKETRVQKLGQLKKQLFRSFFHKRFSLLLMINDVSDEEVKYRQLTKQNL